MFESDVEFPRESVGATAQVRSVFYAEGTETVTADLRDADTPFQAVAVDTRGSYSEWTWVDSTRRRTPSNRAGSPTAPSRSVGSSRACEDAQGLPDLTCFWDSFDATSRTVAD